MSAVLDCPMDPKTNDAQASSVRGYLAALLRELWNEQEAFSGKRPFGNSDWCWEVYAALVKGGLVRGAFDEDGYLDDVDTTEADRVVREAIAQLAEAAR